MSMGSEEAKVLVHRITTLRLGKYLAVTDGNQQEALRLYAFNSALSEAFYIPLQSFSFWVALLVTRFDSTLWRFALHLAFPNAGAARRDKIHGRMNTLRRFRNRIAHHEPIVFHRGGSRDNGADYAEILEAIGWMCSTTRDWTAGLSRVPDVLAAHPLFPERD